MSVIAYLPILIIDMVSVAQYTVQNGLVRMYSPMQV
jgi:hypothetical protein